jgi:hypothetical protein
MRKVSKHCEAETVYARLHRFPAASVSYPVSVVREISSTLYQLPRFHISASYFPTRDFKSDDVH